MNSLHIEAAADRIANDRLYNYDARALDSFTEYCTENGLEFTWPEYTQAVIQADTLWHNWREEIRRTRALHKR